jgi:NAD(P)H-hydrate epimerase
LSPDEIISGRFGSVREFSGKYNVNILMKSETSFSCLATGEIFINSSGNETLASAGSGDVLSGIVVSLLALSSDVKSSMLCGAYLHGMTADLYYLKYGNKQSSSQKSLINLIPKAITQILNKN